MSRKVLLIYTGGTIGMIQDPETGGLHPFNFHKLDELIPEVKQLDAQVDSISFKEPIDSSDVDQSHWEKLADYIKEHYDNYDGFVILHGSDTMAYTASALSFIFNNLSKPVILTGSQLPIGVVRTDGKENIITAIEIASDYEDDRPIVPEVAIYFEYQLYRGNRTYKLNAEHFDAFSSPNYPVLAEAGVSIMYNREYIFRQSVEPFSIDTRLNNKIAILSLFPGISPHIVEAALNIPENELIIIRTYGSGNAMTARWFLDALENAINRGLIIVNVSQCRGGGVLQGRYRTSYELAKMGVIPAGDMILEAAVAKSMHLLGIGLRGSEFKSAFIQNLKGEITV
jgi:L-asparaginase